MMFVKHTDNDHAKNSITFTGFDRIETDDEGTVILYDSVTGLRFCEIAISRAFRECDIPEEFTDDKTKVFFPKNTLY